MIVLDSSIAFKFFVAEPGSADALELLREGAIAPEFVIVETLNAAWKLFHRGQLSSGQAEQIANELPSYFSELVSGASLARPALRIAIELDHPVYDAFYVALAEERGTIMVTADDRLYRKTRRTKFANLVRRLTIK